MSTPTLPEMRSASRVRLHGLDALRGFALLLGIVFHATFPYSPIPWVVNDTNQTVLALPLITVTHLFRMTVFMLLAGYFGRMMVQRRGARAYLKDRLTRIALPVVVFWPFAVLPLAFLSLWAARVTDTPEPAPPEHFGLLQALTPGQLWFLVVLTQITIIVLAGRWLVLRVLGARAGAWVVAAGRVLSGPWALPLAAVPYAVAIMLQGTAVGGLIAPETVLGSASALVAHGGAFLVGWAMQACGDGIQRVAHGVWPWVYLVVGVMASFTTLAAVGRTPLLVQAVIEAIAGWGWTLTLLGLCARCLTRERWWIRYLADASYWMYLVHLPLVITGSMLLVDLRLPALVKLVLVLVTTVPIMLASYEVLVRHTWLGGWLNGRKHPRP